MNAKVNAGDEHVWRDVSFSWNAVQACEFPCWSIIVAFHPWTQNWVWKSPAEMGTPHHKPLSSLQEPQDLLVQPHTNTKMQLQSAAVRSCREEICVVKCTCTHKQPYFLTSVDSVKIISPCLHLLFIRPLLFWIGNKCFKGQTFPTCAQTALIQDSWSCTSSACLGRQRF